MSKQKLSVHLRVYRGQSLTYNEKGECITENHIVKLEYGTQEYNLFLDMLPSNGFIKGTVEKVLDVTKKNEKGSYDEVKDFDHIQKEIDAHLVPKEAKLTPEQERIAALEAKIEALTSGDSKAKEIKVNDAKEVKEPKKELSDDEKAELDEARKKYVELYGKKGHNGWDLATINQKIAEFKPE